MAKWLITALIVICMTSAYAATLIDREDFESYTAAPLGYASTFNRTLFFVEVNNKWDCYTGSSEPTCVQSTGVPSGQGGNFSITSSNGNKFLHIWALGGTDSNYYETGLIWNQINSSAVANQNFTLKYDIRFVGNTGQWAYWSAASKRGAFAGVTYSTLNIFTSMPYWNVIGGTSSPATYSNYTALRDYRNATDSQNVHPSSSSCDISDGEWHTITKQFTTGASCQITRMQSFVDGVQCSDFNTSTGSSWGCGNAFPGAFHTQIRTVRDFMMYFDNIEFYDGLATPTAYNLSVGNTTICDSFTLPYYLKESFNGRLYQCNWSTSNSDYYYGQLFVQNNTFFYAQKDFASPVDGALLSKDSSRYATISYDLSLLGANSGENWELRLYDDSNKNVFTIYTDANSYYYVSNAAGVWLGNLSTSTYNWKIVIDLTTSKADIYLNNVLLENDATMAIGFYNVMDIKRIKVASANVEFTMDNLHIYSSDASGLPQLPDVAIVPGVTDNDTMMCGLMYRNASACNQDSDCITGECMPTGRCSQFDWTYCDEHGKFRGNYCYFSAIASCGGKNVSSIIFDNFLWVLVAIVILMGVVYLSIMVRRR